MLAQTTYLTTTPRKDGFWMPAEWYPHEATWLTWPKNTVTWPDGLVELVEQSYFQMITALLQSEIVKLLVDTEEVEKRVLAKLESLGVDCSNLTIIRQKTADSWIRDFGPTFVVNERGERRWCKWTFNAWGGKYATVMKDDEVFYNPLIQDPCYNVDLILEGGSIEVNGKGTCLTSEQCLLNKNRNPHLSKEEIEQHLKDYLGVNQIIWLKEGVEGDDTDGHIDDIARFVNENTIVAAYEGDRSNPNFDVLNENWEILKNAKTQEGHSWNLIKLPMPAPILDKEGIPLPASYANFYIGNHVVLMPSFSDPKDQEALQILKEAFPTKKVVEIPSRNVVFGRGTVHCLSQQEPKKTN